MLLSETHSHNFIAYEISLWDKTSLMEHKSYHTVLTGKETYLN
jgi:hypothetical protein